MSGDTTSNTLMRDALEPVRDEILTELQDHITPEQGSMLYALLEAMIAAAESNQTIVVGAPDGERLFVLPLDEIERLVARWVTSIKGVVESFHAVATAKKATKPARKAAPKKAVAPKAKARKAARHK